MKSKKQKKSTVKAMLLLQRICSQFNDRQTEFIVAASRYFVKYYGVKKAIKLGALVPIMPKQVRSENEVDYAKQETD